MGGNYTTEATHASFSKCSNPLPSTPPHQAYPASVQAQGSPVTTEVSLAPLSLS